MPRSGRRLPSLRTSLLSLGALLFLAGVPADPSAAAERDPRIAGRIERLRSHHLDGRRGRTNQRHLRLVHELLGLYWSEVAPDRIESLPPVRLLPAGARFSGCGRRRAANAYCRQSSEIVIDARPLARAGNVAGPGEQRLIGLTVLAHEWGHHLHRHGHRRATPAPYRDREEHAADWRAGRFLGWLMRQGGLTVEEYTEAADLLFRIGDFHQASPHGYPLDRYRAFVTGVGREILPAGTIGPWHVDTGETFSRRLSGEAVRPGGDIRFAVYRFEVERGAQVAGNLLTAAGGVLNCFFGSRQACAGSLVRQGTARPQGWFRLRSLHLNCSTGSFDIEGDGIARQPIARDQKGQAQRLAQRVCGAGPRRAGNQW